jgi:hypothetical protein
MRRVVYASFQRVYAFLGGLDKGYSRFEGFFDVARYN